MYGALTGTPTFIDLRQRPDGTFPINPYSGSNPFETVEKVKNNETVWRFVGTGSADLEILQGDVHDLTLSAVGGVDWFQQKNNVYAPPDAQFEPRLHLPPPPGIVPSALFVRYCLHRKGLLVEIRRLAPRSANDNQDKPFRYSLTGAGDGSRLLGN